MSAGPAGIAAVCARIAGHLAEDLEGELDLETALDYVPALHPATRYAVVDALLEAFALHYPGVAGPDRTLALYAVGFAAGPEETIRIVRQVGKAHLADLDAPIAYQPVDGPRLRLVR